MDSVQRTQLVEALSRYGLNEYEAKAYLALLRHGPATAGEISRRSGIPRPRVYDTLQRLNDASLVSEDDGNPKRYSPLSLSAFLRQMTAEFQKRLELLQENLSEIENDESRCAVFHVHDEAAIVAQAEDLIETTRKSLVIRAQSSEVDTLLPAVERALSRGIEIEGLGPDSKNPLEPAQSPGHLAVDTRAAGGNRRIILIRDDQEILLAHVGGRARPYGIRTRNPLIVEEIIEALEGTVPVKRSTAAARSSKVLTAGGS